jgi:type I restriction enzyme S subunit
MNKSLHTPAAALSWPISPAWSRLDDASFGVFDCPHTTPVLVNEGPYVVRSQDIRGRVFDWRNAGKVTEATYQDRIARAEPQYGDLLYSREGTYFGIAAEVPKDVPVCLGQRMVLIRPDVNKLNHRFLLYWLNSPVMDAHLGGFRDGSVAERLNMTTIRALPVPLLPLSEQCEIAAILGALDDKIEVNRKASATLEEMARALYRSWFVDFDPVWAKLEGRQPAHMDAATAALFPDSFDDDGLPVGWRSGKLSDVAVNPRNGVKPEQISPETPYIGLEHMPRRSITLPDWGAAADVGSQKSGMCAGDFLFGKLRPYFHKVGIAPVDGICSTDIIVVRAKSPEWAGFVLSVISTDEFVEHTNAGSSGTRMPRTNWSDMGAYEVTLPPGIVASAYDATTRPWRDRIVAGVHENRTLAALRDTLLPRLMSGELRVGEARELVEEVA